MKKFLLISLILLSCAQCAFALNVVYPKKNSVVINAKSSFLIGNTNPKKGLTVNGVQVNVHPSGGFAYKIPLNVGKNTFTLVSGDEKLIYDITKPAPRNGGGGGAALITKEYDTLKYAEVTTENTPIRTTPVDAGINRIAHMQKGMPLVLDGEKGGFYSIILGSNKTGWISKNSVKLVDFGASLATMNGYDTLDTPEFKIYVFHLNKMTPFELVEGNPFTIKIFNVENQPENTYKLQIPIQKLYGYSGRFSGTDFVVKIRKNPPIDKTKPLKGIKITIDAGHGGSESGAIGCLGNLEKNTMLEFAKHLERELKHRGAIVFMTREDDSYVGLRDRVDFANDEDSVFLISLHGNALPDGLDPIANNGTEVYYYYNQAKPLADLVLSEITTQTGMNNHKVRQASFALVRNTNALSILIEIGFLINPSDNAKLVDKEFQKKTVGAIADGISNFLKN